mgnify:CR=1 FL=1
MPAWTMDEFLTLLQNDKLSDQLLATQLGTRTEGAVAAVRGGVDGWHRSMNHSMLNQMMIGYLATAGRPRYKCARCGGQV